MDNKKRADRADDGMVTNSQKHDEQGTIEQQPGRSAEHSAQQGSPRYLKNIRNDNISEATLTLPSEWYQEWLELQKQTGGECVGQWPSASDNPLSRFLLAEVGIAPRLHTDGERAWVMLNLTKAMRGNDSRHLRLKLPAWTVPLALAYTAFDVERTSGTPMKRDISPLEGMAHLRAANDSAAQ